MDSEKLGDKSMIGILDSTRVNHVSYVTPRVMEGLIKLLKSKFLGSG
jgi:hypothetical protein